MILALTWQIDGVIGSLLQSDVEELVRQDLKASVLYPWHTNGSFKRGNVIYQSVAITIKNNTNIVTSAISAIGDFARVASNLVNDVYEPCSIKMILSYEWIGGLLGSFIKKRLGKPMITSVFSIESMRSSEKSLLNLSIRGLEVQSLYRSDVVVARTNEVMERLLGEYRIPSDKVKLAKNPAELSLIVKEVLRADEGSHA